jgi:hypothetical protein
MGTGLQVAEQVRQQGSTGHRSPDEQELIPTEAAGRYASYL